MTATNPNDNRLQVRLSPDYQRMVAWLAKEMNRSNSDAVRQCIYETYVRMQNQPQKENKMHDVTNANGKQLDFAAAVNLMDDDIREQLANQQDWQSDQEFFTAYENAHAEKHGEWELSKRNPTW